MMLTPDEYNKLIDETCSAAQDWSRAVFARKYKYNVATVSLIRTIYTNYLNQAKESYRELYHHAQELERGKR